MGKQDRQEFEKLFANKERQIISTWILPNNFPKTDEEKVRKRIGPIVEDFKVGIKELHLDK